MQRTDLAPTPAEDINCSDLKIAIIVCEWNAKITNAMRDAAVEYLVEHGMDATDITIATVPGSFELVAAASWAQISERYDAIICFGCVIRGDTPHFDYVCQAVTQGLTELNTKGDIPVIFGVLTVNTLEQAEERALKPQGNKGAECAYAAVKMVRVHDAFDPYFDDDFDDFDGDNEHPFDNVFKK